MGISDYLDKLRELNELKLISLTVRDVLLYFLPSEAINDLVLPALFVAYSTILSHLRSQAVTDTLNDLQDSEVEEFVFNNTNVNLNVRSVSSAVIWSCRDESNGDGYYKSLYLATFILIALFSIVSFTFHFLRPEFCYKRKMLIFKTVLSTSFFYVGLLLLVVSFDTSPWSCLAGSLEARYTPGNENLDFTIAPAVKIYPKILSVLSIICFAAWIIANAICFYLDTEDAKKNKKFPIYQHIFVMTENDNVSIEAGNGYYEVNYTSAPSDKVPKADASTLSDNAPKADKSTLSDNVPKADKSTVSDNVPEAETSTQSDNVPEADKSTPLDNVPKADKSTQSDNVPKADKSTQSDNVPEAETSTQSDNVPQADKSTQQSHDHVTGPEEETAF